MVDDSDVERVASAAGTLAPAVAEYLENDFVMNLLETVLDYQMHTTAVVRALEHFKANRWTELRTLDDLEVLMSGYPDDQDGNTALAGDLWGNRHWRRAHELRGLAAYFRSIGVVDQETLKAWAHRSEFHRDFEGRVKGLGPAVYQWLVMRQGVDTVKPDVHVRKFVEAAVGRALSDIDVVDVVTRAARVRHQGLRARLAYLGGFARWRTSLSRCACLTRPFSVPGRGARIVPSFPRCSLDRVVGLTSCVLRPRNRCKSGKPSSGLEPETPSLPWRIRAG